MAHALSRESLKATARRVVATGGHLSSGTRMTPDFLIVGAQRCGTTSLFRLLSGHPQMVPPLMHKGVHYFDTADHYARGFAWYRGHFPVEVLARHRAGDRPITGEASPYYLFHPGAAQRISQDLARVRAIVLVRDPVERALSAYRQETARGFETEPLERALELEPERLEGEEERILADLTYQSFHHQHHAYVRRGEYAWQIRRLQQALGADEVVVFELDELVAGRMPGWEQLTAFLGIQPWRPKEPLQANARAGPRRDDGLEHLLRPHFKTHDVELADLLGRAPSWMR